MPTHKKGAVKKSPSKKQHKSPTKKRASGAAAKRKNMWMMFLADFAEELSKHRAAGYKDLYKEAMMKAKVPYTRAKKIATVADYMAKRREIIENIIVPALAK